MSNKPLVSIGLPTHNRAATLGRAIESALNQDYLVSFEIYILQGSRAVAGAERQRQKSQTEARHCGNFNGAAPW